MVSAVEAKELKNDWIHCEEGDHVAVVLSKNKHVSFYIYSYEALI